MYLTRILVDLSVSVCGLASLNRVPPRTLWPASSREPPSAVLKGSRVVVVVASWVRKRPRVLVRVAGVLSWVLVAGVRWRVLTGGSCGSGSWVVVRNLSLERWESEADAPPLVLEELVFLCLDILFPLFWNQARRRNDVYESHERTLKS